MALETQPGKAKRQPLINARFVEFLTQSWSYLFLLGLVVFFSLTGTGFFSVRNFSSILTTSTLIMLMSIGQTYVVITAGIDLSIGWTVGLSSVTTARVMRDLAESGNDIAFAMLAGIFAGLLVALIPGLVNGVLVARIKVPPFIATLGMFGIVRGVAFLLTDGQQVVRGLSSELREALRLIGNGSLLFYIPDHGLEWFALPPDLPPQQLRFVSQLLPYPVLITALVVIIFAFILARTKIRPSHLRHWRQRRGGAPLRYQCRSSPDHHLCYLRFHGRHRRCTAPLPLHCRRATSRGSGAAFVGRCGCHRRNESLRRRRQYYGRGRRLANHRRLADRPGHPEYRLHLAIHRSGRRHHHRGPG